MAGTLERLLERIRDGVATAAEITAARELARHDARLPVELRGEVLLEDAQADAAALLGILGGDGFSALLQEALADELDVADGVMAAIAAEAQPVAAAVREEAGRVEITAEALEALGDLAMPVAEAVRGECGTVDVVAAVMDSLGVEALPLTAAVRSEAGRIEVLPSVFAALQVETLPMSDAILAEAGTVDVLSAVFATLRIETLPLAEAVRAEGGQVDLSDAILTAIGASSLPIAEAIRDGAGEAVPMWNAVHSNIDHGALTEVTRAEPLPASANSRRWAWSAMLLAAVALITIGLTQFGEPADSRSTGLSVAKVEPLQVIPEAMFAMMDEISVENLEYGDNVEVMQMVGDEGAMILWVNEGEVL